MKRKDILKIMMNDCGIKTAAPKNEFIPLDFEEVGGKETTEPVDDKGSASSESSEEFVPLFEPEQKQKKGKKPKVIAPSAEPLMAEPEITLNSEKDESEGEELEEEQEEKEIFQPKEDVDKNEVYGDLQNLITHISKISMSKDISKQALKSKVLKYKSEAQTYVDAAVDYIETSMDINNAIATSLGSKYKVVDNFDSLNQYFSGDLSYLNGNTINPLKHPSEEISIFGIKVNDYLIFIKNFKKICGAYISGINSIKDVYKNIGDGNIINFHLNLLILQRLYSVMSDLVYQYDLVGAHVAKTRGQSLKADKAKISPNSSSQSEQTYSSSFYIGKVNSHSGLIDNGENFLIDYQAAISGGNGAYITLELGPKESVGKMSLEEVEMKLFFDNNFIEIKNPMDKNGEGTQEIYTYWRSMRYLNVDKKVGSNLFSIIFTDRIITLLSNYSKLNDYSPSPIIKISLNNSNNINVLATKKDFDMFKFSSDSATQTKYKVEINGDKKAMSVAEIYMARQSGKKVKVLGMYSLSEDVKGWTPKGK